MGKDGRGWVGFKTRVSSEKETPKMYELRYAGEEYYLFS